MANIELLRILSMAMVVMLHYLSKGQILPPMEGQLSANGCAAWILETFSIVAVNVYMLISGFFLVESGFKSRRLIQLMCQVLFYSVVISALLMAAGVLPAGSLTVYKLLIYVLPTQMEHYWFVTAYVIMYLFSPILSTAVKHMKQKQLAIVIWVLLIFFSVNKSVLPVRLEMDRQGYDGIWFICVYLVAAYMRLYGLKFFDRARKGAACYLAGCAGIFGIALLLRALCLKTGMLSDFVIVTYNYNHILNLITAISLFYTFYNYRLPEGKLSVLICKAAPYTFGVYLLHEQIELRNLWPGWLGASADGSVILFVLRALGSVLLVLLVGLFVDWLRSLLFGLVGKLLRGTKPDLFLDKLDAGISGRECAGR